MEPMRKVITKISTAFLLASLILATPTYADEASDIQAITTTLKGTFDKPDNPLTVTPIVASGDYAVADWSQGGMGGRALLRRTGETWHIALCSGDGLRSAAVLHRIGLPSDIASELAAKLAEAEKGLDEHRLAQLAGFNGTVAMDAGPLDAGAATK